MFTKSIILKLSLSIGVVVFISNNPPKSWHLTGYKVENYQFDVEEGQGMDRTFAATIKSINEEQDGNFVAIQGCKSKKFLGKRIRMSGMLKSKNVSTYSVFWIRVDTESPIKGVFFDNMFDRSIKGTTDWTKYELVINIPENAYAIYYGAILAGNGQIWFDDLSIEVVDNDYPLTGMVVTSQVAKQLPKLNEPSNMDFETN